MLEICSALNENTTFHCIFLSFPYFLCIFHMSSYVDIGKEGRKALV